MKLLLKLFSGIIAGIIVGSIYYFSADGTTFHSIMEIVTRLFITMQSILGSFIFFLIPLIIFFFIADGVSSIGRGAGKVVGATIGVAYISTIGAGLLAFVVAKFLMPIVTKGGQIQEEGTELGPLLEFDIPAPLDILTALVLAFSVGIVINIIKAETMKQWIHDGKQVVEFLIEKVVITILPFYIAGVFAGMASTGTVFKTLSVFGVVLLIAIALHWIWITIQYTIAGSLLGKNPFKMIKTMLPAYVTALGTMSSAATISVTLPKAKEMGVRDKIADFVIPLGANIHLSGSAITITSCSIAVMSVLPEYNTPGMLKMIGFVLLIGVVMVAAPGVPGGAVMAASGILVSHLGFNEAAVALMIALYMAQDSFGTAANITGDGAIAGIIDAYDQSLSKK
ncbi:dicarboxylate/amino acid:cation symporter [Nosocomiicoccus massiliensis]|uniref:Dicarboxylate/amino acid:cation symporter n=1 Tax=Nosocomiicoccus massiliensis TaxID=1232430 RepID=A0AAF0YLH0_9STAP|nr:dicarboxylate/amino acid:cation symporter [Nosocomiicoccus massiliensis]WOS95909.1 dicarboxylate/amino acid:cation symporter [Nosocomiicoccus massiliensis]